METNLVSEKKQALIDSFKNSPIQVDELVYCTKLNKNYQYKVISVDDNSVVLEETQYRMNRQFTVDISDIDGRYNVFNIGENPFESKYRSVRPVAYSMDSIIFNLELSERKRSVNYEMNGVKVNEVNWNPYIYNKDGKKEYYQRGFVWTLEDNQLLIESIYKGIGCGAILIRKRGWKTLEDMAKNGETDLAFSDIVDGKQRLNAIRGFINNEFSDLHGNYYNDLSRFAQNKFSDHQLFYYAELGEDVTDEETIYQFLKLNHAGKPQSKEHIEFVTNLLNKLK